MHCRHHLALRLYCVTRRSAGRWRSRGLQLLRILRHSHANNNIKATPCPSALVLRSRSKLKKRPNGMALETDSLDAGNFHIMLTVNRKEHDSTT
jgi:hypothetical protein